MKELYYYKLNHSIYVYNDLEDDCDLGTLAEFEIYSNFIINRVDLWEFIQKTYGSYPDERRKEKYFLNEVVDGIYNHYNQKGKSYLKVVGKVNDNLGECIYSKEREPNDYIVE